MLILLVVTGSLYMDMANYIRQAAARLGIDPDIAIRVAQSEGLQPGVWQSNVMKGDLREPSYGPFQLLKGGDGTGFPAGMGNDMLTQTGLDPADPKNWAQGIDFALGNAAKNGWGAWNGAKAIGLDPFAGINRGVSLTSVPDGPKGQEAYQRMAPALPPATEIQDRPIGDSMPAAFDDAAAPGLLDKIKEKLAGGGKQSFADMAAAFGGGGESSAPDIRPSSIGMADSMDASRVANAQQLFSQLLASKRRVPGKSLMG